MKNPIVCISDKYRRLAGSNIADKSLFAAYRVLYKLLLWRGVVDQPKKTMTSKKKIVPRRLSPSESYKQLVCITGFGHSGSGALRDLLAEYDTVTATGYSDPDGSLRANENSSSAWEWDIARQFGGLFSIEDAMMNRRTFDRDSTIKIFLALISRFYNPESDVFGEGFRVATRNFLDSIVDYRLESKYGYEYCPHLNGVGETGMKLVFGEEIPNCIFHLKNLDRAEYREIANRYIDAVLRQVPSKENLVLDQPLSDTTGDIHKYREYFGNCKLIAVYRDPRDVLATVLKYNVTWIPRRIHEFVRWYRDFQNIGKYLMIEDPNFLLLRFEDLVLDYERTKKRVEGFLGLSSSAHTHPKSAFDPAVSAKNVGLWRTMCTPEDLSIIKREMAEFCYDVAK